MTTTVIRGGDVYTLAGSVVADGVVVIVDGKIAAVGRRGAVVEPAEAQVIDATGLVVTPGLIDPHTHMGQAPIGSAVGGFGDANESSGPVTPSMRAIDSVDFSDPGFRDALYGGVTALIVTPGSGNVVCGSSIAVKTAGPPSRRVLRDPAGLKLAWRKGNRTPSSGTPYPQSKMGIAGILREAFEAGRRFLDRGEIASGYDRDGLSLIGQALRREIPCRIHCFTPVELEAIFRIQDEYGVEVTIEHGFEAHLLADEVARRRTPVIFGPGTGARRHKMFPNRGPWGVEILHRAGVKLAFQTDHPDQPIEDLRLYAGLIGRHTTLTADDLLPMLTINAAEILGVADRLGSLEPGKDADIVLFTGHPLAAKSAVERVLIDGETVYRRRDPSLASELEGLAVSA